MLPVAQTIARRAREVALEPDEMTRYSRHLLLPEIGAEGQRRLKAARVLVIGAGGLGSPVCLYLAAAGVGTLGLVEFDLVDTTNLQRQILYRERDAGAPKLDAAAGRLRELNSKIAVVPHAERLTADNAARLFEPYDVIVDGTDNFATRYLVNDACVLLGKPLVYGSIFRFDGQAAVFYAPHGPCYRCLFPSPPPPGQAPSCAEAGVLGVLPAQVGSIQANETLKLLLGVGRPLLGRLLTVDALAMRVEEFRVSRDPACPVCGERPTIKTLERAAAAACAPGASSLSDSTSAAGDAVPETTPVGLRDLRSKAVAHLLLDVRTPGEAEVCRIEGSILIPLAELERRLGELPRDVPIVVHCKSGARSARAVRLLAANGFERASSLSGGILAWIDACQPELPKY